MVYVLLTTKPLTVFSNDGIITRDSLICTAYGHRDMKYTYIDTTRQSYRYMSSSYKIGRHFQTKVKTYVGVVSRRSKFDSVSAHAQSVIQELQEND